MRDRDVAVERINGSDMDGARCQETIDQIHVSWRIARRRTIKCELGDDFIFRLTSARKHGYQRLSSPLTQDFDRQFLQRRFSRGEDLGKLYRWLFGRLEINTCQLRNASPRRCVAPGPAMALNRGCPPTVRSPASTTAGA